MSGQLGMKPHTQLAQVKLGREAGMPMKAWNAGFNVCLFLSPNQPNRFGLVMGIG